MDIEEFLRARLDEDEQEARKAIAMREETPLVNKDLNTKPDYALRAWPDVGVPAVLVGPERILREVAAKRAVLGAHEYEWMGPDDAAGQGCAHDYEDWPCPTICAIAAVYADHEDYNPEWR